MKRLIRMLITTCFTLAVFITASYAWFTHTEFVEPNVSGYSVAAYFGGGDGSSEKPFLIKNQRHLYNLAWLQYLGYFNQKGEGNVKDSTKNTLTQYSFKLEVANNNLDMDGWYLPPIGTSLNPFIGSLDGNNTTISNLNTTNDFEDFGSRHPGTVDENNFANCEIIGFVGAIGTTSTMNLSGCTISSNANNITDLNLSRTSITTTTEETLCGIVAGYVNGKIENVGVLNSGLDIAYGTKINNFDDVSSYTVVGYAESDYLTRTSTNKTIVLNPTTTYDSYTYEDEGNITGWGGSIAMQDLYQRILNVRPGAVNSISNDASTYVSAENRYINITGKTNIQATSTQSDVAATVLGNEKGTYVKYSTSGVGTRSDTYHYLTSLSKDVAIIEKTEFTESGYKIKSLSGYYLNMTSTKKNNNSVEFDVSITDDSNSDDATVWVQKSKNGGYELYTYNEDDGYKYYLNATTTNLSISDTSSTTWKWDSNYGYYISSNSINYYLRYISSEWIITNQRAYLITDGQGNYLTRSGTNIINAPNQSSATKWIFENEDSKTGIIYDEDNTDYKLYLSGTSLTASTNYSTSWSNTGTLLYSGSQYIIFDNNEWKIYQQDSYMIKYGDYYLSLNSNGSINNSETDFDNASIWKFSNISSSPQGYISTTIDDTIYYLSYDNGLTLATTQQTQWSNDGNGIYVTINSNKYYLIYENNTWKCTIPNTKTAYKVSYNSYYLNADGTTSVNAVTNSNNATNWYLDNSNHLYCTINGTNYYLYYSSWSSSIFGLSTNSNESYMPVKNNNYLVTSGYYMYYDTSKSKWSDISNSRTLNWQSTSVYDLDNTPIPSLQLAEIPYQSTTSISKPNMTRENSTIYVIDRNDVVEPSVFNYIPLNASTSSPYTVDEMNTGYLMAGNYSYQDNSSYSGNASEIDADIRVSRYEISNIAGSYSTNTQKFTTIYTVGANGMNSIGSTYYPESNYYKYNQSKTKLLNTIKGQSNVYGLHFMSSNISIDHLITVPKVSINGKTEDDYQMPEDCIDFQLASRGFINFFSGYYYSGNNSFFSLHEIIRDGNNNITDIKHISKVYKANSNYGTDYLSADFIYEYSDGTFSGTYNSSKYDLIFNCSWIETPGVSSSGNNTKLFYFEIPVNKGEFALGSVDGGTGAYLIYLDIGANAQRIDRTITTQKSTVAQYDYVYPTGIAIISSGETVDDSLSVAITLNASGTITLSKSSNVITATNTISNIVACYKARTITLNNNSTAMQASAVKTTSSIYSQIQYIDYNTTSGDIYETNIQQIKETISEKGKNDVVTLATPTLSIIDYKTGEITSDWKLYGIVQDESGNKKNRSFAISSTQDDSDGYGSQRTTLYNNLITQLTTIANSDGNSILEYYYDIATDNVIDNQGNNTDTFAIHIDTHLDDTSTSVMKYLVTGDTINVTTNNSGTTTIYVTTVDNTNYVFKINATTPISTSTTVTMTNT